MMTKFRNFCKKKVFSPFESPKKIRKREKMDLGEADVSLTKHNVGRIIMSAAISIMWESTINCRPFDSGSYPSVVY